MKPRIYIASLLTLLLLLTAGARITYVDHQYNHAHKKTSTKPSNTQADKRKNLHKPLFTSRQAALLPLARAATLPTYPAFSPSAAPPSHLDLRPIPYLSAAQGMEVHLAGLEWNGRFIENGISDSSYQRFTHSISSIHLDPDDPKTGRPDLFIDIINAPEVFSLGAFSGILPSALHRERPVDSWKLVTGKGEDLRMELWLVSFDMTFRIEPSTHPAGARGAKEFRNQGYDNLTVFLKFLPKSDAWYASDTMNAVGNATPHMAVAAAECLEINHTNTHTRLGINLAKGQALPLYPSFESAQAIVSGNGQNGTLAPLPVRFINEQSSVMVNPALFDIPRYSCIELGNLGSWKVQPAGLFSGARYQADQYHVKFLVHLYVIGDWMVRGEQFVDFQARAAFAHTRPGLADYLLPDFRMGFVGRLLSGALLIGIVVLIFALFFPAVPALINTVLRGIHSIIKRVFIPKS